jgi:hypothetical protein
MQQVGSERSVSAHRRVSTSVLTGPAARPRARPRTELAVIEGVVDRVLKNQKSQFFRDDPVPQGLPRYTEIVKQPMWLHFVKVLRPGPALRCAAPRRRRCVCPGRTVMQ